MVNATELGNARRLVATHGDSLRYSYTWNKWLVWDGRRWEIDDLGAVEGFYKDVVSQIWDEALTASGDERSKLASWALKSEQARTMTASLTLARSESGVAVRPEDLDRDPYKLNCLNGTVDLRSGTLLPHDRVDLITKLAPVEYDPDASCPRWLTFLDEILAGNGALIAFLQRALGYALTGDTGERVLFVLWGSGANGKSTLLELAREALGDYALRTPTETLLAKKDGGVPNDVARLRGARLVTASETEDGKRFAEAFIKDITGGDTISARFMRAEWFDFKPQAKIFLGTNHKPTIRGTDNAIWDRIRLIPFTVTIPEERRNKHLGAQLREELPGILAWMVAGCLAWQRDGLGVPDAVRAATAAYRSEQDVMASFIEDCCVIDPGARALSADLHAAYKAWCDRNGEKFVMSTRVFGMRLTERGFAQIQDTHGRRGYKGIGLLAVGEPPADTAGGTAEQRMTPEKSSSPRAHQASMVSSAVPLLSAEQSPSQIQKTSTNGRTNSGYLYGVCADDDCTEPATTDEGLCDRHLADAIVLGKIRRFGK